VTSWKELAIRMQLFSAMRCDYMTSQNVYIYFLFNQYLKTIWKPKERDKPVTCHLWDLRCNEAHSSIPKQKLLDPPCK